MARAMATGFAVAAVSTVILLYFLLAYVLGNLAAFGVIALLESRSRRRPWRYGFGEARRGDPVAIVLNTEPASILTTLGSIGSDEGLGRAVVDWTFIEPKLLDLATLVHTVGFGWDPRRAWRLEGDDAVRMRLRQRPIRAASASASRSKTSAAKPPTVASGKPRHGFTACGSCAASAFASSEVQRLNGRFTSCPSSSSSTPNC